MNRAMTISTWAKHKQRVSGAQCGETRTLRSKWEGRKIILPLDPTLSLRQTASEVGVSVNTVRKVKAALEQNNNS